MDKPIFQTSYLGSKVRVYKNRLEWTMLMIQRRSVPISQIASVQLGIPLYAQVTIETTGGKKYKIPVAPGRKKALESAIYSVQS